MIIVAATEKELKLLDKDFNDCKYIVTGEGALNVIHSLQHIDRNEQIFNIGYAGSNFIPIGTKIRVGEVRLYHPNVNIDEQSFKLDGDVLCYTSNDFVLETKVSVPCVFDMELAYILALGFKNVISEKIISDNLNLDEFERMQNGKTKN